MKIKVVKSLQDLNIPASVLNEFPDLPPDLEAMLVYGSRARGDAGTNSDLDLLGLVPSPRKNTNYGDINITYYTSEQLSTGVGTLFGYHLKRDARILIDDTGELHKAIANMGEVDTDRLFSRARSMTEVFTNIERDLPNHLSGLNRQARYLLRSCLYAQAIQEGRPCFSVQELSVRLNDCDLPRLLSSRPIGKVSVEEFQACLSRLRGILGDFPKSTHGSLESLVINEWETKSDLLSIALLSLGPNENNGDYAEVEMILL